MRRNYLLFFIWLFLFFPLVRIYAAMMLSVSDVPSQIDQAQDFEATLDFICESCTSDSYIRAVFYESGTNYFGYTQNNNGNWVNASGGNCNEYFKITADDIKEGSWSGKIKVKPDGEHTSYNGPGTYRFKIGRYPGSCSGATWSQESNILISGPTITLTPAPTSRPPTPTHSVRPSPIPTEKPYLTNTIAVSVKNSPTKKPSPTSLPTPDILGVTQEVTITPTTSGEQKTTPPAVFALLLVGIGFGMISGVLIWQKKNIL